MLRNQLQPLRSLPEWQSLVKILKDRQTGIMQLRMKQQPGSSEDTILYLRAKAIDELFTLLDTIDTQATVASTNREQLKHLENHY